MQKTFNWSGSNEKTEPLKNLTFFTVKKYLGNRFSIKRYIHFDIKYWIYLKTSSKIENDYVGSLFFDTKYHNIFAYVADSCSYVTMREI